MTGTVGTGGNMEAMKLDVIDVDEQYVEEQAVQGQDAPAQAENKYKTNTLYIWGLDKTLAQAVVKEEFSKFVQVDRVTIIKDKPTGISKGFGYVACGTPEDATKAMKEMDGKIIGENPVRIKYSFSQTPDWLKYLDSKGDLDERPRQNRGRGRGRGRGRERTASSRGSEYGRYPDGDRVGREDCYPYVRAAPGRLDDYERRPLDDPYKRRRPYNAPYERRPYVPYIPYVPYVPYERRPPPDDQYEKKPVDDQYERKPPLDDQYERRPLDNPYKRRPIDVPPYDRRPHDEPERRPGSRDDPYKRRSPNSPYDTLPPAIDGRRLPGRGRDSLYSPTDRRDIYKDRRELYRPSEREGYMEPIPGRDQRRRSPRDPSPVPIGSYRARSPIYRLGVVGDRDPYVPQLHKDDVRRVSEAKPAGSNYYRSTYEPVRESTRRHPLYEGSYSERFAERRPDPYATVEPRI